VGRKYVVKRLMQTCHVVFEGLAFLGVLIVFADIIEALEL
jgi:hypothetical protein